jgi:hypothetical protein
MVSGTGTPEGSVVQKPIFYTHRKIAKSPKPYRRFAGMIADQQKKQTLNFLKSTAGS